MNNTDFLMRSDYESNKLCTCEFNFCFFFNTVPSPDANISVSVKINSFRQLMVEINVS